MSANDSPSRSTPDTLSPGGEGILRAFEQAWVRGEVPVLADFLTAVPASAERLILLRELIHIDLEFRMRSGQPVDLDSYKQAHPELLADPQALLSLIGAEIRLRLRQEAEVDPEEYQKRFPEFREAILPLFVQMTFLNQCTVPIGSSGAGGTAPDELPVVPGYQVLEVLGRGGMGVVYRARQVGLNRIIALKMLLAGVPDKAAYVARFRVEAEAVAQLQHPHIVQIHEIGEHTGQPFFCMEYMAGGSLAARIADRPLPVRQVVDVVETLARALHAVHKKGIVHRDLKPANVLLTADGVPKIADFGVAKRLEGAEKLTQTGAVVGTPAYMAPEQAAGNPEAVTPAADIYALGAILYELLTGQPPFQARSPLDVLFKVLHEEPVPPRRLQPRLHRDLETVCLKALARAPARRYATALALAEDLERFNTGEPIQARREGPAAKLWRKVKRRPLAWLGSLAAVLAVVVAGALFLLGRESEQQAERKRHQAGVERRVSDLQSEFEAWLDRMDWSAASLRQAEALLPELEELAPKRAQEARERLHQRFETHLREQISRARLSPDDVQRIREQVRLFGQRVPATVGSLEAELKRRERVWETVFELKAPFANLAEVFKDAPLKVAGDLLQTPPASRTSDRKRVNQRVLSLVPCQGNVKLEAVLHGNLDDVSEVGLLLNAGQTHTGGVTTLAFSPNGRLIASAGEQDRKIGLWDVIEGRLVRVLVAPTGVSGAAFHPDGNVLAVASGEQVVLLNPGSGKQLAAWRAHQGRTASVAYSRDGMLLATGGGDRSVKLWSTRDHSLQKTLADHPSEVSGVSFGEDNKLVAVTHDANHQRTVRQWDLNTGGHHQFTARFTHALAPFAVSRDGKYFAGASAAVSIQVWDIAAGKLHRRLPGGWAMVAFVPSSNVLAAGLHAIPLWDVRTGAPAGRLPGHHENQTVGPLAFSPDGDLLVNASSDGTMRVWDVPRGTQRLILGGQSYAFLLSTVRGEGDEPAALGMLGPVLRSGGKVLLQVLRDGAPQRSREVALRQDTKELRLLVSQEDDLVSFQLNDQAPLEFRDLFAISGLTSGVFGMQADGRAEVAELRAWRKPPPQERSPLEKGDELFQSGKVHQALAHYEQQALAAGSGGVGAEARCKQALCLHRLRRHDEGDRLFRELMMDPTAGRWSQVAACQLWLNLMGQKRFDEAAIEAVFEYLFRNKAELGDVISAEHVLRMLETNHISPVDFLFLKETPVRKLQRVMQMVKLFDLPWSLTWMSRLQLLQGQWGLGRHSEARQIARDVLAHLQTEPADRNWPAGLVLGEACWLLRRHGDAEQLLRDINRLIDGNRAGPKGAFARPLLIEKARLELALGKRAQAEATLAGYLQLPRIPQPREYYCYSAACLMGGYLCEDRGEHAEAVRWWRKGLHSVWAVQQGAGLFGIEFPLRDLDIVHHMILSSLAGELSDDEAQNLLQRLVSGIGDGSPVQQLLRAFPLPRGTLREMWRTPRGKALARKIAFRDLELEEFLRGPACLAAYEVQRPDALPAPSADQDALLWKLNRDLLTAYGDGQLASAQLVSLGLAWKTGLTGPFGWDGAVEKMAPELRGPLAYLFGHRMLRLNKRPEAERLFCTVMTDAPATSAVHRLAREDLARVQKK